MLRTVLVLATLTILATTLSACGNDAPQAVTVVVTVTPAPSALEQTPPVSTLPAPTTRQTGNTIPPAPTPLPPLTHTPTPAPAATPIPTYTLTPRPTPAPSPTPRPHGHARAFSYPRTDGGARSRIPTAPDSYLDANIPNANFHTSPDRDAHAETNKHSKLDPIRNRQPWLDRSRYERH